MLLLFDDELAGDTFSLGSVLGDGVPELGVPEPDDVARLKGLANPVDTLGAVVGFVGVAPNGELSAPNGLLVAGKLPNTFDGLFENIVLVALATG